MSEENGKQSKPDYDFEFITQALGLIPINEGSAAIAPGSITSIAHDQDAWLLNLSGEQYTLTDEDMAELEATIRQRSEVAKLIQKEAMRNQAKMQIEVMAELNSGVQPGLIVGGAPGGKRFRQ
jgi:hypothetical protein